MLDHDAAAVGDEHPDLDGVHGRSQGMGLAVGSMSPKTKVAIEQIKALLDKAIPRLH